MAILVDHIVDQIEVVPIEAVDKGKPWPVAIAETDDALGLEWDNTSGQEREDFISFWPGLLYDSPCPLDSFHLID